MNAIVSNPSLLARDTQVEELGLFPDGHWHATRAERLRHVRARGLSLRPDFDAVAARWESWWRFEASHPLLRAAVPRDRSLRWDNGFDLMDRPDDWVRFRRRQVENLMFFGEEVPSARVNIGPVALAAFLGAPLHLAPFEHTSWQDPIIEEWPHQAGFALDPNNTWFRRVADLMRRLAQDAAGNFLVCFPDVSGALDTLANLRGSERLCLDLFDNRGHVLAAARAIMPAWGEMFASLSDAVLEAGAGTTQWLGCWSDRPYAVATCDFNALIGCDTFEDVCLPSLHDQAQRSGRCIFHLDGYAAARHADALAADPAIHAIQFVPGAGTPSTLPQIDMLRRVQAAGKPVLIACLAEEVEAICRQLDPRGLALMPSNVETAGEAETLVATVARACANG
jgi:hypothetical protein